MIAPLAPFVDPGSRLFEEAERFGYRLFYRTLGEHRQATLTATDEKGGLCAPLPPSGLLPPV